MKGGGGLWLRITLQKNNLPPSSDTCGNKTCTMYFKLLLRKIDFIIIGAEEKTRVATEMADSVNVAEDVKKEVAVKGENQSGEEPVKDNKDTAPGKKDNKKKGSSKWNKKDTAKKTFKPGKFKKFKNNDGKSKQKKKPKSKN